MKTAEPTGRSPERRRRLPNETLADLKRSSFIGSIWSDAVLEELKKQSSVGCVLCSLEELDAEDWD